MHIRREITVTGIVQGVGFRPFVFRLAKARCLTGGICNTTAGVRIEVQGPRASVESFIIGLQADAPPLARITAVNVRNLPAVPDADFRILASQVEAAARALIPPDVAVCADCLRELRDPGDRRHRYPFINCTNCGPRFTIVRDIPYDRPQTSMAPFRMCPACQAEYDDPANRRFHAQPNACWDCGPRLALLDGAGRPAGDGDPIREAAELLRGGAIVAIKGLGGFHLAVDARQADAVSRLRERKRRVGKPFAVMVPDVEAAERLAIVDPAARARLLGWERPIVILPRRDGGVVAEAVAPGHRDLGVFLPYTPVHHLLFDETGLSVLVMTSGNLSEEPIAIDNDEAVGRLRGIADAWLVHDRDILRRCDDSVVTMAGGVPRIVRRARGHVPVPIFLHEELAPVLAVGGELKNTICLAAGGRAFLSQHVGDLEHLEAHRFFEEVVDHFQRILEIHPSLLACDLHPGYFSTRWAEARTDLPRVAVQHHHAHVAACMAEHQLDGPVIGVVLDGTGYGTDGRIWGGEVLVAGYREFVRAAHLAYMPMPGGEAAIREPWRMAVGWLASCFGVDGCESHLPAWESVDPTHVRFVRRMVERGVNTPLTSGAGRLFDAVAALLDLHPRVTHEAEAAIALEMAARGSTDTEAYPLTIAREAASDALIVDTRPLAEALLGDRARGRDLAVMSRRFHNGLVQTFSEIVRRVRGDTGLTRVCLSGGCFQNRCLLEGMLDVLTADGFDVYSHRDVPTGDGGLSLGQALVAAHTDLVAVTEHGERRT